MRNFIFLPICFLALQACNDKSNHQIRINSETTIDYVFSRQKPNGAFGPLGMEYTDVAWTYPAVHTLKLLDTKIPQADSCYQNGHQSWMEKAPWKNGPWYWSLHQKANLYRLLDKKGALEDGMTPGKKLTLEFSPREDYTEFRDYVDGKFYDMASLWYVVNALEILEGSVQNPEFVKNYVLPRQTQEGGFEEMLGESTTPQTEKAHVIVTYHAVMILQSLNIPVPEKEKVIDWLRSCQMENGGFSWHPRAEKYTDVWYTWAAVRALDALGATPANPEACLQWLNSLQNADGGFGDRPGWRSRLYSTYYAVHAIDILTGDVKEGITTKTINSEVKEFIPEGKYDIFQAHHKSPKGGRAMVDTAVAMGFNLLAVKTTEKELYSSNGVSDKVRKARKYAKEKDYPIEIVDAPENYSHRLRWFSGMNGNHVSNYMIPPGTSDQQWQKIREAHQEGKDRLPWQEFKTQVIAPVLETHNLFYPELDYTMANAYMTYDEGLFGDNGYNAVPAAHFGNYDWVRHFPYKERWIGQLPMIADGDAHGPMEEWRHNLESFRNIYIAEDYTYDHYIEASLNGRSVCVIKMPTGEVRYYGSEPAVNYLKSHKDEWQWW